MNNANINMSGIDDIQIVGIDEDLTHKSSNNDEEFDTLIGHLQDVVLEDQFQEQQEGFLAQNCDEFDDEEENKLIYTELYNEYINKLESYISERLSELVPGFTMSKLLELVRDRKDEVDTELFDTLASLADFMLFKETMLNYKSQKYNTLDNFPSLVVTSMAHGLPKIS